MPCGLNNLGNTCYMNTALQCLYRCSDLSSLLQSSVKLVRKRTDVERHKRKVFLLVDQLFSDMGKVPVGSILSPKSLVSGIEDSASESNNEEFCDLRVQHDTSEFMLWLMDVLHTCMSHHIKVNVNGVVKTVQDANMVESIKQFSSFFSKDYSAIVTTFYGQYQSSVQRLESNEFSYQYDPYFCIQLQIPVKQNINLFDCMNSMAQVETIESDGKIIHKRLKLWSCPKYLIIVLKRFDMFRRKRNDVVHVPLECDFREYCVGPNKFNSKYNLVAVANHRGNTNGGHYYAYVKDHNTSDWFICNDNAIRRVQNLTALSSPFAYCLFYEKTEKKQ